MVRFHCNAGSVSPISFSTNPVRSGLKAGLGVWWGAWPVRWHVSYKAVIITDIGESFSARVSLNTKHTVNERDSLEHDEALYCYFITAGGEY